MPENRFFKTRLCNSVTKGYKCLHGEKCRFAHSLDEMKPSTCLFGEQCKYFRDNQQKTCPYLHKGETMREFQQRKINNKTSNSVRENTNIGNTCTNATNISILPPQQPISSDDWVVVETPKRMALEIVQMTIDTGLNKIKLIITD